MSAVIERCGNCKYKLLVDEVELISRIDGAIQNLFQELEDAKKDTYKIQKFLWHWILSHLQKKVLNFFAMDFVYLFHPKKKKKRQKVSSQGGLGIVYVMGWSW